jgi:filamentous hemagglutinin family protein
MKGIDKNRLGNTRSRSIAAKLHLKPLALLVSLLATGQALAVQSGNVTGGAATITQSGATTTIQQTSDRAIVSWNNFDIGQGERVTIKQPNANAAILNRVVGATTATQIQGALDANGRVFVINPNGIVVGQQGSINANGVVLSTLNLNDSAFMAGDTSLDLRGCNCSDEGIRNDGAIIATRDAVLLGNQVVNGATGQITAPQGDVSLIASQFAAIDLMPDGSITMNSTGSGQANALAANDGYMTAGGSVLMEAPSADAIVRNTGTIQAAGLAGLTNAGMVTLKADNGTVMVDGTVIGQQVNLTARDVTQAAGASLHADNDLTATAARQVDLNGSIYAGNTFALNDSFGNYPYVTLNGTLAAQNVDLSTLQLRVTQNATLDATKLSASSRNDMTVDGHVSADSMDLSSDFGSLTIHGDNLLSGISINLSSTSGQTSITGAINTSNLSISTKDLTQAEGASLHADNNLTISAKGQVDLNGSVFAGNNFTLNDSFGNYPNVTLNGTVAGRNINLNANQINILGSVVATSDLSIDGRGSITQTADGLLRFGDTMSISSPKSILLNGTIDAGSWYSVTAQGQATPFGAGLYQPGQGFGGANALPGLLRGGLVTSGTGSIAQDGSATNVVQTSDKLVIDWKDFNIAAGESINFLQPNANAVVLNKVTSGSVTTIDGALNANGRVFVFNRSGIVVGNTGTINVNSIALVAGDLQSSYEDVLSGDGWNVRATDLFYGPSAGLVKNSGDIHAANGVTLIGTQVMNMTSGRIYTWGGNIAMVAGENVRVSQNADGNMSRVDALTATPDALVANDGRITADNSYVKLDAYTSTRGQGEVARNLGQIDALNRTDTMSAPGELAAGNILVSGRSTWDASGTVNIRGRLIGQNVTVHSDGNLYLFGGGVLTLRQQSVDPDFNKITLEGNRITVAPEGFTVEGNAVVQGVGYQPVFDEKAPLNVTGGTLSMQDIKPLAN